MNSRNCIWISGDVITTARCAVWAVLISSSLISCISTKDKRSNSAENDASKDSTKVQLFSIESVVINERSILYPGQQDTIEIYLQYSGKDYRYEENRDFYALSIRPYRIYGENATLENVDDIIIHNNIKPQDGETRIRLDSLRYGLNKIQIPVRTTLLLDTGDYRLSLNLFKSLSVTLAALTDNEKQLKPESRFYFRVLSGNREVDSSFINKIKLGEPTCSLLEKDGTFRCFRIGKEWCNQGNVWIVDDCGRDYTVLVEDLKGIKLGSYHMNVSGSYSFEQCTSERKNQIEVVVKQIFVDGIIYTDTLKYSRI